MMFSFSPIGGKTKLAVCAVDSISSLSSIWRRYSGLHGWTSGAAALSWGSCSQAVLDSNGVFYGVDGTSQLVVIEAVSCCCIWVIQVQFWNMYFWTSFLQILSPAGPAWGGGVSEFMLLTKSPSWFWWTGSPWEREVKHWETHLHN